MLKLICVLCGTSAEKVRERGTTESLLFIVPMLGCEILIVALICMTWATFSHMAAIRAAMELHK